MHVCMQCTTKKLMEHRLPNIIKYWERGHWLIVYVGLLILEECGYAHPMKLDGIQQETAMEHLMTITSPPGAK